MPISRGKARHRSAGFTLIEITIVVALVAMLTGLAAASLSGRQEEGLLKRDLALASGMVVAARQLAIVSGQSVPLEISADARALGIAGAVPRVETFRNGVALSWFGNADSEKSRRVLFYANGGSSGATLALRSGRLVTGLAIDWLTGDTTVLPIRTVDNAKH
jgi:general secretion pathway protein H